jgi:hypothetical protein
MSRAEAQSPLSCGQYKGPELWEESRSLATLLRLGSRAKNRALA